MACCLLIVMLGRHEWSYDRFHANGDRVYRTTIDYVAPDGEVGVGVFALAGLIAVGVALLMVSTQACRAAATDPVKALRTE